MVTNNSRYFERVKRDDSLLGQDCLRLIHVCWMNPWATIEQIPASFDALDVYINHTYEEGFRMNNRCTIAMCN